ncbi:hypothetical protein Agub_g6403 [Astrephomene gubernaculifera]|uniref:SRCR domain-containing protein n=1 Tax=Astrephomene gubernaculifera TaxID=47775 RepID=A0AAD3HLJ0_9CHLO|nr:hypothetical protein Agub_g6403 [Astrephomene gubernaculifera]
MAWKIFCCCSSKIIALSTIIVLGILPCNLLADTPIRPADGDVKLLGSTDNEREGVIQIYSWQAANWVSVCDNGFTVTDAKVVCRQLGFPPVSYWSGDDLTIRQYSTDSQYKWWNQTAMGPTGLTLSCNGTEQSVEQCPGYAWNTADQGKCKATQGSAGLPVGITCRSRQNGTANALHHPVVEGDIKLVSGTPSQRDGIIQIYSQQAGNKFVSICQSFFTTSDARVVCRQLGYPPTGYWSANDLLVVRYTDETDPAYNPDTNLWWNQTSMAPMTMNLNCEGTEASVTLCPGYGWTPTTQCLTSSGTPGLAVGVICKSPQTGAANAYNHPDAPPPPPRPPPRPPSSPPPPPSVASSATPIALPAAWTMQLTAAMGFVMACLLVLL